MTLKGNYLIGFILAENNVGVDGNSRYWRQHNYYSGSDKKMGLWTDLPEWLYNFRYQDVARGVWGYRGLDGSLPEQLDMNKKQTFSYTIEIPDIYEELENGELVSPSIKVGDCIVVAYLYNRDTSRVVNSVALPLSEKAEKRFTTADYAALYGYSGVEDVLDNDETDSAPVYYNLQGQRVENPGRGIYIVRKGGKTEKIAL